MATEQTAPGNLTLITGPMFADKTNTLIDHIEAARRNSQTGAIAVVKPKIDNRYEGHADHIISHSNRRAEAVSVKNVFEWYCATNPQISHLFVDEGHFFSEIDLGDLVDGLLGEGIDVTVAGLDLTYDLEPFEVMLRLECNAKKHIRLKSRCACGCLASFTKISNEFNTGEIIIVGGEEKYQPVCNSCHPLYAHFKHRC